MSQAKERIDSGEFSTLKSEKSGKDFGHKYASPTCQTRPREKKRKDNANGKRDASSQGNSTQTCSNIIEERKRVQGLNSPCFHSSSMLPVDNVLVFDSSDSTSLAWSKLPGFQFI